MGFGREIFTDMGTYVLRMDSAGADPSATNPSDNATSASTAVHPANPPPTPIHQV